MMIVSNLVDSFARCARLVVVCGSGREVEEKGPNRATFSYSRAGLVRRNMAECIHVSMGKWQVFVDCQFASV